MKLRGDLAEAVEPLRRASGPEVAWRAEAVGVREKESLQGRMARGLRSRDEGGIGTALRGEEGRLMSASLAACDGLRRCRKVLKPSGITRVMVKTSPLSDAASRPQRGLTGMVEAVDAGVETVPPWTRRMQLEGKGVAAANALRRAPGGRRCQRTRSRRVCRRRFLSVGP